jgi:hypothetical protein
MTIVRTAAVALAALGVAGAGCGGIVDGTGETGYRDIGTGGGEVKARDTVVSVPEGALEQTETITIDRAPAEELPEGAIAGTAVDLGPDGMQFRAPVTVRLRFDPAQLPELDRGDLVWVGTVVDGEWEPLENPALDLEASTVSGTTTHFSRFAAVFGCGRGRRCPVRLDFGSRPQQVVAGECSEAVLLQTVDHADRVSPVRHDTAVALSAGDSSLTFYGDAGCQREITGLTIPAGGARASFHFRGRADRSVTITAAARDLRPASQDERIVPGPAVRFDYFTQPQRVAEGDCSAVATVAFVDAFGNRTPVPNDARVTLAASGNAQVTFYSDAACTVASSGEVIPAGAAAASFYFSGALTGTVPQATAVTLTATVGAFGGAFSASQDASIVPPPPSGIRFMTQAQTVTAGRCSAPVMVGAVDRRGNRTAVEADTAVNLDAPTGLVTYSDQSCTTQVRVVTIPAGGVSTSFYFKGSAAGTYTITASSGIGSATQDQTIE